MGDFVFLDGGHGFFFSFFLSFISGGEEGDGSLCVCVMGEFELLLLLLLLLEMSAGIATWEAGEKAARLSTYSGVIPSSHQFFPWRLLLNSIQT